MTVQCTQNMAVDKNCWEQNSFTTYDTDVQ